MVINFKTREISQNTRKLTYVMAYEAVFHESKNQNFKTRAFFQDERSQ